MHVTLLATDTVRRSRFHSATAEICVKENFSSGVPLFTYAETDSVNRPLAIAARQSNMHAAPLNLPLLQYMSQNGRKFINHLKDCPCLWRVTSKEYKLRSRYLLSMGTHTDN